MKSADDAETAGLTRFQLQGDAAERYERWAVPFIVGPWVPGLLDLVELRPRERVLDVATGTGVVARLAARRVVPGGSVSGLDLNEGMLNVARRLQLPQGPAVDWRQGSALALPFPDRPLMSCCVSRDYNSSRSGRMPSTRCAVCSSREAVPR